MRQHGKRPPVTKTRLLLGLLAASMVLGACRIRRERPKSQPAPQNSSTVVSDAGGTGVPSPIASAALLPKAPAPVLFPSEPVQAPEGVLVVAAASTDVRAGSINLALNSVRIATKCLVEGGSGTEAVANGLTPFELAVDVPVANGAPRRGRDAPPQCDAILLDALGRISGVEAVADLDSPSKLADEVYRRGWGLVVGDGANGLAAEIGIATRRWSPEIGSQRKAKAGVKSAASDAGTAMPLARDGQDAAVAHDVEKTDAGVNGPGQDAGAAVASPATLPSMAALLLRDGEGHFFIAAEGCGVEGDPVGQLTALAYLGAVAFAGEDGAVFVTGGRGFLLEARHAERIYRRLAMLQVPKVAADWGLRTSEGATMVVIVSRLGSALASTRPIVWARNHRDGETSAELTPTQDKMGGSSPSAGEHGGAELEPKSHAGSLLPATSQNSQPPQQSRPVDPDSADLSFPRDKAADTQGSAGGRGPTPRASTSSSSEAVPKPNAKSLETRIPERSAGQP